MGNTQNVLKWPKFMGAHTVPETTGGDRAGIERSVNILDIENDLLAAQAYLVEMQGEVERAKLTYESHLKRMAEYQAKTVYGHEVAKIVPNCRTIEQMDKGDQE